MAKSLIDVDKAFEVYYTIGASRSIVKLHERLHKRNSKNTPSVDTMKRWSQKYKWRDRVALRDAAVREGIQESSAAVVVDAKIKELEQLDSAMSEIDAVKPLIFSALNAVTQTTEDGELYVTVPPETTADMTALYNALSRLNSVQVKIVETARKIRGESDAVNIQHSVKMYDFDQSKYPEPTET
jgi:hypothetical protein